jgi:hypothetical protein
MKPEPESEQKSYEKVVKRLSAPMITDVDGGAFLLHVIVDVCCAEGEQWTPAAAE